MAQRVSVESLCDWHGETGKEVEGETVVVGIDGKWFALEGCTRDLTKHIEPIRAMLETLGRQIDGGERAHRALLKLAHEGSTATVHALPTAQASPVVQPAKVAKGNGKRQGGKAKGAHICLWCPDYDKTFTTSTGMLLHLETKHGITGTMGEIFGLDCPLCGAHADGGKLGIHLGGRRHPGKPTVTQAFMQALTKGDKDKHGIARRVFDQITATSSATG